MGAILQFVHFGDKIILTKFEGKKEENFEEVLPGRKVLYTHSTELWVHIFKHLFQGLKVYQS